MEKNMLEKTHSEKTIEMAKAMNLIKVELTVKGILTTSVIQTLLGFILVNYIDQGSPLNFLISLGFLMMILGITGTLIYSADLMKLDLRERWIQAQRGKH